MNENLPKNHSFEEILERDGKLIYTNKGFSMMPLLRQDRDLMVIERRGKDKCRKLDAVLFRRPGVTGRGAYVLHRILRVNDDGTYWIVGDNCVTGETVNDEHVLGILTAVVRSGKTIKVTDFKYKLYCSTWCKWYHLRFLILRVKWFIAAKWYGLKKYLKKKHDRNT